MKLAITMKIYRVLMHARRNSKVIVSPIIPIFLDILALFSLEPLTWMFAAFLILASGYSFHLFLKKIFSSEDNNFINIPPLSIMMLTGAYLLLNYLPIPISRVSFLLLLGLLTSVMLTLSTLPIRIPKGVSKSIIVQTKSTVTRERFFVKARNLFIIVFIILFLITLMTISANAAFLFLVWPSSLPIFVKSLSPFLQIILSVILGVPLTIVFWVLLIDPRLISYRTLSRRIINVGESLKDEHSNTSHVLSYMMPSAILSLVLALLPNIIGFLPPGFDTPFHILYLKSLYSNHFAFPFAVPGRLRGARPAPYISMASIMYALGVDYTVAYQIFVITTYVLTTVAFFLLVSKLSNLRAASLASTFFCISLPALGMTTGLAPQLYGLFLFLMSLTFLLTPNRDGSHIVKFIIIAVLMILTHDFVFLLFYWVIATLLLLEVTYSFINRIFRERFVSIIKLLVLCISPFIIALPYLIKFLRIYFVRFPVTSTISSNNLNSPDLIHLLHSSLPVFWSPNGWFGPTLIFLCVFGVYTIIKHNTKQHMEKGVNGMVVISGVLFGLFLLLWFLTISGVFPFLADDPRRAIQLLIFPASYGISVFALNRPNNILKTRGSLISRVFSALNLKTCIIIAFISILLFSSIQYSMGIYPNIFYSPGAPAALPMSIKEFCFDWYETILWMKERGLSGTVINDGTFGVWPSVNTNMTTVIFWSYNEAQIWRPTPFWEKRIALNTSGYFDPLFLLDFASKYNLTMPLYIVDSYGLLGNAFPKTSQPILDRMLDKIYESGGQGKEKVILYCLDKIPAWLLYNITVNRSCVPQGTIIGALKFDGNDDYVSLGNVLNLDEKDFTIELWVKTNSKNNLLISKIGSLAYPGWGVGISVNGHLIGTIHGAQGAEYGTSSPNDGTVVNDGTWHHIAVVFDRNGNMTRYVDGVVDGSQVDISGESSSVDNIKDFRIAARNHTEPSYFEGVIDEVRVYNRALSVTEISGHYSDNDAHMNENGLVLYLPFDEDTRDRSGWENHGIIYGAISTSDSPLWEEYTNQDSVTLQPNYDAEKNIWEFRMNVTDGQFYTIYNISKQLTFVKISPQPSELEYLKNGLRFSGDPSMMYTLTFQSEAPYLNYVWREDIFQAGWWNEGDGNFSSLDGEAILRLKVEGREAFEQIFHTLKPEIFEEETEYFISICQESSSTNATPYSYTIAVRLWNQEREELLYQKLPQYKDCKGYIVTIPKDVAQNAAKIGLLLYGRYNGEYEWRIDSIIIAH